MIYSNTRTCISNKKNTNLDSDYGGAIEINVGEMGMFVIMAVKRERDNFIAN